VRDFSHGLRLPCYYWADFHQVIQPAFDLRRAKNFLRIGAMADIVIINPKFEISFWGFEAGLGFLGKRANLPVGALPLLAALTPPEHHVTLIDENVEEIDMDRCARADIVGITGMSVQRHRMRELVTELKRRGCYVVIG